MVLARSGGKDSAIALYELKHEDEAGIAALVTTVTDGYNRIGLHGVRRRLPLDQAEALEYLLEEITIPQNCSNDIYENRMEKIRGKYLQGRISAVNSTRHLLRIFLGALIPAGKTASSIPLFMMARFSAGL